MEENLKQESSKNRKSNKIAVILLSAIVIVCAALVGLYASGILGVPVSTEPATEEALKAASNVTDEATLRELLLMDCELDIKVTEDIEIAETLVVNGIKKVTSDNLLKASFELEDGAAMLDISKKASLTIDGWNLDGNGVALGVNVNRNATFNHLAGTMEYMGIYGVVSAGLTNLSEKTEISHVGEGAIKVVLEGEVNVEGGKYTDGGNYLVNVESGGILNISGEPLFDGAVNHLVYNYGETTIHGGIFLNSGYRGITNYAKITMEYMGSDKEGYIEVGNTGNVAVYSYSLFKVSYKGVYAHDAGANVFLQSYTGARCYVEDCVFDTGKGNAVSVRGEVYFTNVEVKNATSSGIIIQQNAVATFNNVKVDSTKGRGINVESATLKGENIEVSNTAGIGIAAQVYENIGPAVVELSDVYLHDIKGNGIKAINGATMSFTDSVFEKSKRTNVYVDKGTIALTDVDVLGTLDKDVNAVQVQKDGELTISGKTLITGGTMRAVGIYGGKFTMNNGIIRDNSVTETGAAVHITKSGDSVGTFTMNGGIICNNKTANEKKNASAVNVSANAVFVMKGGEIYGNSTSGIGGGVRVDKGATFKMTGGSIYKNTAKQGAGVYVDSKATVTMSGGSIYGNSAVSGGGGIQVNSGAVANLSGGSVMNNETGGIGDGIRVSGEVTISDDFYVGNDRVALTNKNVTLKVTGNKLSKHSEKDPLLVAAANGVTTGTVVVECDDNDAAVSILTHTASGNGSYILTQKEKNLVVNYTAADMDMTGADKVYVSNFQQLKEAVEGTTSKRYVIISSDIEIEGTVTVPNGTTVYLRDDGVQRTLSRKDGVTSTFFNTRYGTGLYLVGTKAGNLVLDGELSGNAKAAEVKSLVTAQGGTIVDGVTFVNNGSKENTVLSGAFIYQTYGHIDIYDSTFSGAEGNSGAVGLASLTTGYVENCEFTDNSVRSGGGAIRLVKNSELTVKNSVFENNSAGTSGGAVVSEGGTFTAIDCDFKNNTAANDGGVIKSNGGTAKFLDEDGEINFADNNTSGNSGGAIWAKGILTVEAYSFDKNAAGTKKVANGGAIYVEGQTTIATVTGSTFSNNESKKNCGGAISNSGSNLTIDESEFIGNKTTASNVNGGAVYSNNNNASTTISNSRFFDNRAKDGGAIRVTAGTIELENCTFDNNKATENGGAICTTPANENSVVKVTVKGGSFAGNNAVNGGAIFNGQKDNKAYSVVETENVVFDGNYTTGNTAGAIYVQATYTDNGSTFQNNKACDATGNVTKNGGALYLNNEKSAAKLTNTTFDGNEAKDGGAIRFVSGTVVADGCTFKNNKTSTGNGGAICSENAAKTENIVSLKVNNSTFSNNNAASAGGAIYAISGIVEITESNFDANSANGTNANLGGGAICVEDGKVTITGKEDLSSKFTNNSAVNAGAINVTDKANAEVVVENYVFEENSATTGNGGAIRAADQIKLVECQFNKNHADKSWGGAIYVTNASKGKISSESSSVNFTGNNAGSGGAIYYNTDNESELTGWTFTSNTATKGGAVLVAKGSMKLTDCDFAANRANSDGGAILHQGTMLNVTNCDFADNSAATYKSVNPSPDGFTEAAGNGGAIYITGTASALITVTEEGHSFTGNTAFRYSDKQGYIWGAIASNSTGDVRYSAKYSFSGNTHANAGETGAGCGVNADGKILIRMDEADSYTALQTAVANAGEKEKTEITLAGDITMESQIDISKEIILKNGENDVTLSKTSNFASDKYMFNVDSNGDLTITGTQDRTDITIDGANIAGKSLIYSAGNLTVENATMKKGKADNHGGAIYYCGDSTTTLETNNCQFIENSAQSDSDYKHGGAIYINSGGVATLTNTDFSYNKGKDGGAIRIIKGTLIATGCDFEHNTATGSGGAINTYHASNSVVVKLYASTEGKGAMINNTATSNGGAILTGSKTTLIVKGYDFGAATTANGTTSYTDGNQAMKGGAIYNSGGTIYFADTVDFYANSVSGVEESYGGAIYTNNNGTITSEPSDAMKQEGIEASAVVNFYQNSTSVDKLVKNKNTMGGAIYQQSGTVNLLGGGTFSLNRAGTTAVNLGVGGAINVCSSGTMNLKGYEFTQNAATKDGGAIRIDAATANVENCNFTSNSAGTPTSVTGTSNCYNGRGGAIYLSGNTTNKLVLTGLGTFTSNVYHHGTDGENVMNAIYKSNGTVTGANLYSYVDNANNF